MSTLCPPWHSWAAHTHFKRLWSWADLRHTPTQPLAASTPATFAFRSARWFSAHKTKTTRLHARRGPLVAPTNKSKRSSATFARVPAQLGRCATQRHGPLNVRRLKYRTSKRAPNLSAAPSRSLALAYPRGTACTAGSYCPHGSAAGTFCPPGSTSASTSLTSAEECDTCPAGHYCVGGSQTSCGRSTYNPLVGQAMQTACRSCPPNSVTRGIAATSAADCVCIAGYYSNQRPANSTVECIPCPAGSSCVDGGTTLASLSLATG